MAATHVPRRKKNWYHGPLPTHMTGVIHATSKKEMVPLERDDAHAWELHQPYLTNTNFIPYKTAMFEREAKGKMEQ